MEIGRAIFVINPTAGIKLNNYFKNVHETGVIKVMTDAASRGYRGHGVNGWINLGQGMPEPQILTPEVLNSLVDNKSSLEYSPVSGSSGLKESILNFYKRCGDVEIWRASFLLPQVGVRDSL